MAKILEAGGMTFNVGKATLKTGQNISFPRQNLVTGDKLDLPNGTYTLENGKSFSVAGGRVSQLDVVVKEPEVVPEVVVEPEPEIKVEAIEKIEPLPEPVVETPEVKEEVKAVEPEVKEPEVVVPETVTDAK